MEELSKEAYYNLLGNRGEDIRNLDKTEEIIKNASIPKGAIVRPCWFVGASFGGDDQTPRFLDEGIWENGYEDKYLDTVRSIQPGDRIAIKSTNTRKHDLPFDNRGRSVSVMTIKAIGTVTENIGDGRMIKVDWSRLDSPREWYFFTHVKMVWRVMPGDWDWCADALIGFTFDNQSQNLDRFRNEPYWQERFGDGDGDGDEADNEREAEVTAATAFIEPYSIDNILADGCFVERDLLEKMLKRLRMKKNLILQGPPGTGKTWLAKRLAFALMGQRNNGKVRAVQFHPNLSYEDFVRGLRPAGDGKLSLTDGPFMEMVNAALQESSVDHVVVIEEINRGNPAQIFGEMLTLLEADKRTSTEALELCYRKSDCERVYIPGNLYVIGTMNIADRSLALVDLALRRRFAFFDLEPKFGKIWRDWVNKQCGIDMETLLEIEKRIDALNEVITKDTSLGRQFRIGHSYVTPPSGIPIADAREWFRQVVETEIAPQLAEYWFDAPDKASTARTRLTEGF
ncbi:MAG: AAA family ATPase [Nitrospirae bacterium]|nr:AAA family ATPase [Nitrospirota bacterium]